MNFFNRFKEIGQELKRLSALSKQLKEQVASLQESLPEDQRAAMDLQTSIDKFNFKNRPHLARISEAQADLQAELSKYQAHK